MDRKLKIAVIFGGCSSEYPVSLESAHSVIVNLDRDTYELVLLGITKGGEWFRYYGGPAATAGAPTAQSACPPSSRRTATCTASWSFA